MSILQLISSDSFITLNKDLIKAVGLEEAIILGELASEFDYWQKNKGLTEDGYFYSTVENVEDKTTLSGHKQRKALNNLQQLEMLDVQIKGLPAKRYIKLNEENILKCFNSKVLKNLIACPKEIKEQELKNFNTNNNIDNNNITNKNIAIDIYISEVKEIVDYLNQQAKMNYRANSENTKKHILARLNEKFTVNDFKHVIDVKCSEWLGTDMEKYLRPETLFGSKFENYLQQKNTAKKPSQVSKPTQRVETSATPEKSSSTPITPSAELLAQIGREVRAKFDTSIKY